jgi:hypothetical protein
MCRAIRGNPSEESKGWHSGGVPIVQVWPRRMRKSILRKWRKFLHYLSLSFLISKTRVRIIPSHRVLRVTWEKAWKALSLAAQK